MNYTELAGRFALALSHHLLEFEERELRFLLIYLQHLNAETQEAHMSITTLARKAGMSQATAYRALSRLKGAGWLVAGENHRLFLGPRFLTAVQTEPHRGGSLKLVSVNQPPLETSSVRSEEKKPLGEAFAFALTRKGVEPQRLQQLVTQHGEAKVLQKATELAASYPDDSRIRSSFMGLLVKACQDDWVFTAEPKPAPVAPIVAPEVELPEDPSQVVAVAPDGQRFAVSTVSHECVKLIQPRQTRAGTLIQEVIVVPASYWHSQGWKLEAA